jgi:hypothetical protein
MLYDQVLFLNAKYGDLQGVFDLLERGTNPMTLDKRTVLSPLTRDEQYRTIITPKIGKTLHAAEQ